MISNRQAAHEGRVPFRIRIGVTGHRELSAAGLGEAVRTQVARLEQLLAPPEATPLRLAVVSQLAEGADRLVVRALFEEAERRGEDARLEVVLPLPRDAYAEAQGFDQASRAELEELLAQATTVTQAHGAASPYELAGRELVDRCDVLIALWDGEETGGAGGTAETLLAAAAIGMPCIWISTESGEVRDNLWPGSSAKFYAEVLRRAAVPEGRLPHSTHLEHDTLASLRAALGALDAFNRERLPRDWEQQLERELGSESAAGAWSAPFFLRATLLAGRAQSRFLWFARTISLLASLSAVALALSLTYDERRVWHLVDAGCFLAIGAALVLVRRLGLHRRWLTYRFLAERLRSAHYLAATGVDFRRTAGVLPAHVENAAANWPLRAFEEIWDGRDAPHPDTEHVRKLLADEWIGGQIDYYGRAAARHHRAERRLGAVIISLFAGSVVFACTDAVGVLEKESLFLSITLPVIGAALGALLSVQQHRPLAERYHWMQASLVPVRRALLDADAASLADAGLEGARIIAEESGDWFGAMWFLDIEHPP